MKNQFLPLMILYPFRYRGGKFRINIENLDILNKSGEKIRIGKVADDEYYPDDIDKEFTVLRLNSIPEYRLFVDLMHTDVLEDEELADHFTINVDTHVPFEFYYGMFNTNGLDEESRLIVEYTLLCDKTFAELIKDKLEEFKVGNDSYKEICKEHIVETANDLKSILSAVDNLKEKLHNGIDKICKYTEKL